MIVQEPPKFICPCGISNIPSNSNRATESNVVKLRDTEFDLIVTGVTALGNKVSVRVGTLGTIILIVLCVPPTLPVSSRKTANKRSKRRVY